VFFRTAMSPDGAHLYLAGSSVPLLKSVVGFYDRDPVICVLPAYGGGAIAVTELAYGPGGPIADEAARKCQSAVGKASVNYFAAATKAIQACLDKVNKGTLRRRGDALPRQSRAGRHRDAERRPNREQARQGGGQAAVEDRR
jgi:hypothetical protein